MEDEPYIDSEELRTANARHDREGHTVAVSGRLPPSWNEARMILRGRLTDKKVAQYAKMGFYSLEYRKLRKERMEKKAKTRTSNFVENSGRLIYSPI